MEQRFMKAAKDLGKEEEILIEIKQLALLGSKLMRISRSF